MNEIDEAIGHLFLSGNRFWVLFYQLREVCDNANMFKIRLFGPPEIWLANKLVAVPRRKSRAVLYYLAAQNQPVQRAHLLEMFWIDLPRPQALQTQRSTLYGLRRVLGDGIQIENDQIQLHPAVEIDARRFLSGVKDLPEDTSELIDLMDLYRGDFLEGFSVPDSQAFEDWLIIEREHFRRLAIRGLNSLSKRYEILGDYHKALTSIDRALSFNVLQEDLHRERIRLLYFSGDRPGAIRHYDYLRRLLDDEMGVPPMKETRNLYDALINDRLQIPLQGVVPPAPAKIRQKTPEVPGQLPFTGRNLELEFLVQKATVGRLLLIEGEPGIGKTRLVNEFLKKSSSLVITAAARELEHTLPYLPWIEGLRRLKQLPDWPRLQQLIQTHMLPVWYREMLRLVPDIADHKVVASPDDQEPDEVRLWEGVHQFLRQLTIHSPVTVFLDDLQWADSASLGLFGYLVRQDDLTNISFLATTRSILPGSLEASLVQTLTRFGRLERLQLGRLDKTDILRIARYLTPDFDYPFAEWLQRNSEGIPFVLHELIRHLENAQILRAHGKIDLSALSATPLVPRSVYLLIESRIGQLSDPARRFLDAAVAAGREFDLDLVARAAALSDETAWQAVTELQDAGLILPQSGLLYRFDHSLTMEVAYQMIGEPRHRIMHRRIAEALEVSVGRSRIGEMAAEIATHFMEGNVFQRAAPYAYLAGMQAARLAAWHEAIDFYEQALLGFEGKDRFPVLMALGQASLASGALAQASDTFQAAYDLALEIKDHEKMDTAALALAQALLPQARYHEAIAVASRVRNSGLPQNAVAAEFTWGTALSLEGAHLDEAAEHLQLAQTLCCEQTDLKNFDPINQARILFELGGIAAQKGELTEAIDLYRQVRDIACSTGGEGAMWCALAHNNLAYHLLLLDDPGAQTHAETGLHIAQEYGLLELLPYLYSTLGEIALAQPEFISTAEDYFEKGILLAEQFEMEERIAGITANLGRVELQRGNLEKAKILLNSALEKAEALGTRYQWAQIQLWMLPLLSADEQHARLNTVRTFAEEGGRKRLIDQIIQIETQS